MGYYTDYTLSIQSGPQDDERVASIDKWLEKNATYSRFDDWSKTEWYLPEAKWYEYEEDMRKLSIAFPDNLFLLHGEGEDREDMWDDYWQNGKHQFCPYKFTVDDYDPRKMKE